MLVLTRKCSESIVVGGEVVVSVQSIRGRKVRLGVQAPAQISIVRSELAARGAARSSDCLIRDLRRT